MYVIRCDRAMGLMWLQLGSETVGRLTLILVRRLLDRGEGSPGAWVESSTGVGSRRILEAELVAWWGRILWSGLQAGL